MNPALDPLDHRTVLLLFGLGMNTAKIARCYTMAESDVANMLAQARDALRERRAADNAVFLTAGLAS